jgi:hypothetical protein
MLRQLGAVLGIAGSVAVFAHAGGYGSPQAFADGFAPALLLSAGLSVAGAIAGVALPRRVQEEDVPVAVLTGSSHAAEVRT